MHPATQTLGRQLDMLYGLYQLALDLCKSISVDDAEGMHKRLAERQRLLRKTEIIAAEARKALTAYEGMRGIPANEAALISEKKQMILDVLGRMCDVENTVLRSMHSHMVGLRRELVGMDGRQKAIQAYRHPPVFA